MMPSFFFFPPLSSCKEQHGCPCRKTEQDLKANWPWVHEPCLGAARRQLPAGDLRGGQWAGQEMLRLWPPEERSLLFAKSRHAAQGELSAS